MTVDLLAKVRGSGTMAGAGEEMEEAFYMHDPKKYLRVYFERERTELVRHINIYVFIIIYTYTRTVIYIYIYIYMCVCV